MAKTVADQFAEVLATAGVKRIYGLVTSAAGLPSLTYSRTIRDDQNQLSVC